MTYRQTERKKETDIQTDRKKGKKTHINTERKKDKKGRK